MQHTIPQGSSPTTMSKILQRPSMSTDLNPSKHTWNDLERHIQSRVNAPANVCELFQALKQEWVAIPEQVIHNQIQSMPERYWAIIDFWGGPPPPQINVHFPQSQNTKKSVKIMNFDLNQQQYEIWWTWFLLEFSNNSILKQTKYVLLFMNSIIYRCTGRQTDRQTDQQTDRRTDSQSGAYQPLEARYGWFRWL